jgi:hypothetical protein
MEHLALISVVRVGVTPLAVLLILQLIGRWVGLGKLDLLLP